MSGAQFLLGNVLQIKPILTIDAQGELGLQQRIRSEKKATNKIVELLKHSCAEHKVKKVGIMHGNVLDKATELFEIIEEEIPGIEIAIGEISSSLAVHGGEGTVALFWQLEN